MEWIVAALVLGLAGSLHCLGMCGPLVMAVHSVGGRHSNWKYKVLYHAGRIFVYALLGAAMGAIGKTFAAFGFQQYLAIAAGVLMLLFIAWPVGMKGFKGTWMTTIKAGFSRWMNRRSALAHWMMGMFNGLLPCGLVYVALAASLAFGDLATSAGFMALFGLGTTPSLFAAGSIVRWLTERFRLRSFKGIQIALACISLLVILRGANLGIPYVSPKMSEKAGAKKEKVLDCCSRPH
jgi:uncharacterized protein